jgi:hypothetical protein
MSTFGKVSGVIFWGAVAWLVAAAFLAIQFWPAVPSTARGWVAFVALGPPLWFLAESVSEWLWSTRSGRAVSNHPSSIFRILVGVILCVAVFATWLGASWFFNIKV